MKKMQKNTHLVVKDVSGGVGQEIEDPGLQVGELLLVFGHSQQELSLALLDVRPLFRDDLLFSLVFGQSKVQHTARSVSTADGRVVVVGEEVGVMPSL